MNKPTAEQVGKWLEERRLRRVYLDREYLLEVLRNQVVNYEYVRVPDAASVGLPEDVHVEDVWHDDMCRCLWVLVAHESFEPVPDGAPAPSLNADRNYVTVHLKEFVRREETQLAREELEFTATRDGDKICVMVESLVRGGVKAEELEPGFVIRDRGKAVATVLTKPEGGRVVLLSHVVGYWQAEPAPADGLAILVQKMRQAREEACLKAIEGEPKQQTWRDREPLL